MPSFGARNTRPLTRPSHPQTQTPTQTFTAHTCAISRGVKEHGNANLAELTPLSQPPTRHHTPITGAIYISRGFKEHGNANLTELELGYNEIKDDGAIALAQVGGIGVVGSGQLEEGAQHRRLPLRR